MNIIQGCSDGVNHCCRHSIMLYYLELHSSCFPFSILGLLYSTILYHCLKFMWFLRIISPKSQAWLEEEVFPVFEGIYELNKYGMKQTLPLNRRPWASSLASLCLLSLHLETMMLWRWWNEMAIPECTAQCLNIVRCPIINVFFLLLFFFSYTNSQLHILRNFSRLHSGEVELYKLKIDVSVNETNSSVQNYQYTFTGILCV